MQIKLKRIWDARQCESGLVVEVDRVLGRVL